MKHGKRMLCALLLTAMIAGVLSGCSNKVKIADYATTAVGMYGDQPIYMDEVYYLVKVSQVTYDYYFSFYGQYFLGQNATLEDWYSSVIPMLGSDNLTTWNLIRENVFRSIYQTRVLCDQAEKLGISLSEDDLKKVDVAVKNAMEPENRTLIDASRATEELIRRIYTENALAMLVYDKISEGYDTSIVRDEYKTAVATYFTISKDSKEETDEKAKAEAIEKALKAAVAKYELEKEEYDKKKEEGEQEEELKEPVLDVDQIKTDLTDASDAENPVTFYLYKDQNIGISEKMTDLQDAVWSMKEGEVKFVDTTSAYYVIYLSEDDNEEAVQQKIDAALEERKEKKFTEEYQKLLETAPKLVVYDKIYEANIKFEEINYPEVTTAAATDTSEENTTGEEVSTTEAQ